MNKLFLSAFILMFSSVCFAENFHWVDESGNEVSDQEVADFIGNNFMNSAKEQAKENLPIYEKLKNCLPAKGNYIQVLGLKDSLCHFKFVDYDCYFPQEVAQKYAELGIKSAYEILNGIFSTETDEAVKMEQIISNKDYCSYNMTWSVTMEDENGNEVPVEGIIIE